MLSGIELLLYGHMAHESDVSLSLLEQLHDTERRRFLAQITALGSAGSSTPNTWWLPEHLPAPAEMGAAELFEPEGMMGASCSPTVLAVVRSAIAASGVHVGPREWRYTLAEHSRYRLEVHTAEACMREAGLWPWPRTG